jgi:magnesium-transporting ATPase (P-type)
MPDTSAHPSRRALAKFWAPVPWLLEVSIILEIVLHKDFEAVVIAVLLVFNAALAYFQESHAQATRAALKSRLALNASVQRDFAGALVRRGEATAVVTATGARTKFGRTAELVRTAHVVSTQQKGVLQEASRAGNYHPSNRES